MKVAVSILSMKENPKECVRKINKTNADYIHLDIMDGIFVSNSTWNIEEAENIISDNNKELDVHLMVHDLDKYINEFIRLKPKYITFHYEITKQIDKYITLLKENNIGCGISIKPDTDVSVLEPWLSYLDLVLIMSVEPGIGGQKFMNSSLDKISWLRHKREVYNANYLIEVDGGINDTTALQVKEAGADMVVSGSYITNGQNYQDKIDTLRK